MLFDFTLPGEKKALFLQTREEFIPRDDPSTASGTFPPREGDTHRGSDTLTAYLLASAHEAAGINPAFALPGEVRAPMERGLIAFVEEHKPEKASVVCQEKRPRRIGTISGRPVDALPWKDFLVRLWNGEIIK